MGGVWNKVTGVFVTLFSYLFMPFGEFKLTKPAPRKDRPTRYVNDTLIVDWDLPQPVWPVLLASYEKTHNATTGQLVGILCIEKDLAEAQKDVDRDTLLEKAAVVGLMYREM